MTAALARLHELARRHAAGDDVLAELRALEAELRGAAGRSPATGDEGSDGNDQARAALLGARFRAGPLPLAGDAPPELQALSARLVALPIGRAAGAEVRAALDDLAARARERDDAAARGIAEARRAELHAQVLELLGELLETLDGRRR
jgi:hypothetical protein